MNDITKAVLETVNGYLKNNFNSADLSIIYTELFNIVDIDNIEETEQKAYSYEEVQEILSTINEKQSGRKSKGVYYTPSDVVDFILINCAKMACGKQTDDRFNELSLNDIDYNSFCYEKTIYDPTCGSGSFLLSAVELKLNLLRQNDVDVTSDSLKKTIATVCGNDLDINAIIITKIRIFLFVLYKYGVSEIIGVSETINSCFSCCDYIKSAPKNENKYDIIVGNPPYIEDSKSNIAPLKKYGNVYANVLENASEQLSKHGVLGFIIPLSYTATPRMKKIREILYKKVPKQYILNYSDRPDCLFTAVHQKLCILFAENHVQNVTLETSNYMYWYKEERRNLFVNTKTVKNEFATTDYIPKLGTFTDIKIYEKIKNSETSIIDLLQKNTVPLYLNMRATFWIKAFLKEHIGAEYKVFKCENQNYANLCMCLLNSSLFWWYWICVSDCWHITKKELCGFKVPKVTDFTKVNELAVLLENELERTKKYVGTKQTEYEYKHKECVDVIHKVDDFVNALYGLTADESEYIKNFAYKYRIGGGAGYESN